MISNESDNERYNTEEEIRKRAEVNEMYAQALERYGDIREAGKQGYAMERLMTGAKEGIEGYEELLDDIEEGKYETPLEAFLDGIGNGEISHISSDEKGLGTPCEKLLKSFELITILLKERKERNKKRKEYIERNIERGRKIWLKNEEERLFPK